MMVKKWNKADFMLLAAGALFIFAVALKVNYPDNYKVKIFLMVAEACLVGGVADWFATEALFRRPLGFSYHTALVPRNRMRLIESLSRAVEHDFLSKESIRERLGRTVLLDLLIDKIQTGEALSVGRKIAAKLTTNAVLALNPERIGRYGEEMIKNLLKGGRLTPLMTDLSKWALNSGKITYLYNFIISELTVFAAKPETRDKIYYYLQKFKANQAGSGWFSGLVTWVMEETNSLNLEEAAQVFQEEIIATLNKAGEENSPIRHWFMEQLEKIIKELPDNAVWVEAIEVWKTGFISKLDLAGPISDVVTSFKRMATDSVGDSQDRLVDFMMLEAAKYWQLFKTNAKMREETETYLHYLANALLDSKHHLVGVIVTKALVKMTDQDLVAFVEEKTSEDLAWIRINGVVVGGIAGLILGLFLHFVYDPYLMPLFKLFF